MSPWLGNKGDPSPRSRLKINYLFYLFMQYEIKGELTLWA